MMTFAGYLLLIILFSCGASADTDPGCNYNFSAVLVWTNDKIYTGFPFYFGDVNMAQAEFGVTAQDLEDMRQISLGWLTEQFGIPTSGATYDPATATTTVPGWGTLSLEIFTDCYVMIASSTPHLQPNGGYVHLKTLEFTFNTAPSNPSTAYGGRFGQLYQHFGLNATVQPADSISSGFYYIFKATNFGDQFIKRVGFRALYPTRSDMPIRVNEELQLFDQDWGVGTSVLRIENVQIPSLNQDWSQITGVWKFPATLNAYNVLGIN